MTQETLHTNIEVEQNLLAAIMVRPESFFDIDEMLLGEHFSLQIHEEIFNLISKMNDEGQLITPDILQHSFSHIINQIDLTSAEYIQQLCLNGLTTHNNSSYSKVIVDLHMRRKLLTSLNQIMSFAKQPISEYKNETMLENIECELNKHSNEFNDSGVSNIREAMHQCVLWMEKVRRGEIDTIKTGFIDLDKIISGFYSGGLYVIGARPGMGKTVLGMNLAENISKKSKVLFFSLEMSSQQLAMRQMSGKTGISVVKQQMSSNLSDMEYKDLVEASFCNNDNLFICDKAGLNVYDISRISKKHMKKNGLSAIFIDYLGLISGNNKMHKVHQISEITCQLKILARNLDIPIILLSQLNRSIEQRDDKRPTLSDLRDSGSIEQDADVVMFIYREDYYLKKEIIEDDGFVTQEYKKHKGIDAQSKINQLAGLSELVIAKNRQGITGVIPLLFDGCRQQFSDSL